jgi:hypothetical protein
MVERPILQMEKQLGGEMTLPRSHGNSKSGMQVVMSAFPGDDLIPPVQRGSYQRVLFP